MKLTPNTPTKWARFRRVIGLPGKTRVTELTSDRLAMFFLSSPRRGEDVVTEQERAEFGCPATQNRGTEG